MLLWNNYPKHGVRLSNASSSTLLSVAKSDIQYTIHSDRLKGVMVEGRDWEIVSLNVYGQVIQKIPKWEPMPPCLSAAHHSPRALVKCGYCCLFKKKKKITHKTHLSISRTPNQPNWKLNKVSALLLFDVCSFWYCKKWAGLSSTVHSWVRSCIQAEVLLFLLVIINTRVSVTSGVPQGSTLAPLLVAVILSLAKQH